MMTREDLSGVKAGDHVVVNGDFGLADRIQIVQKVTPTQIVLKHARFNKETGQQIGADRWNRSSISISPAAFGRAKIQAAEARMRKPYPVTREGVDAARAACELAESVLREMGKWEPAA